MVLARQRERLIDSTQRLVAKRGYQATSVSAIAASAHVARPVFYKAFPGGKEECLIEAYDQTIDELFAIGGKSYTAAGGGLDGIEAALRTTLARMAKAPETAQIALIEIAALGDLGLKHRDAVLTRIAELLQDALRAIPGSPAISEIKVRALLGGCYQLLYLAVTEGRTAELPALVPDILYMLLAYRLSPKAQGVGS